MSSFYTEKFTRDQLRHALRDRLEAAAPRLGIDANPEVSDSSLLNSMCVKVMRSADPAEAWLLFTAITGTFPLARQLANFRRLVGLGTKATAIVGALEGSLDAASRPGVGARRLLIVEDQVVVDVAFCASFEHNTGIQRVVRQTMPHWQSPATPHVLVTWTHDSSAMRLLNPYEEDRVLHWNRRRFSPPSGPATVDEPGAVIVVPWKSRIFLPEVPQPQICLHLAAISESSGNRVTAIGYDAIPLVSADGQSNDESERFAHYLTVLKHSDAVLGISESAAGEFRGFSSMLRTQGLTGPRVSAVSLATEASFVNRRSSAAALEAEARAMAEDPELPLVLCVGSHEPRKNQEAVLHAANVLLNEGLRFEMVFIGGGSASALLRFDDRVTALQRQGHAVSTYRRLTDAQLAANFTRARFSVFVSLHEGFGLPVAESLALGVPVLASNYGSVAEVAAKGGCLLVDPRDDEAIIEGMRRMITDDNLINRLRDEAKLSETRSWNEYANDLWSAGAFSGGSL